MTSTPIKSLLAVLFCTLLTTGCQGLPFEKPPIQLQQNMHHQTRVGAQQATSFFADNRGARLPVEGTVARGELRIDDHLHRGLVGGQFSTNLPMPLSAELLDRGEERYNIFCAPCHGASGDGNSVVAARSEWIIPTFHNERAREMPVGQFYDIITNGINTMPAYRAQIRNEDRWAIAAYLRALQVSRGMAAADLPAELRNAQGRGQ